MNVSEPLRSALGFLHRHFLRLRYFLPRRQCTRFLNLSDTRQSGIGPVYVINLDRQPNRWADMLRELDRIVDASGRPLSKRAVRYSAHDGSGSSQEFLKSDDVDPYYTLKEQLFVEPQPLAAPDAFNLSRRIRMTKAEIAVACSHIGVWRAIARSDDPYALVLEDDVWFRSGFAQTLEQAWKELEDADGTPPTFDVLYASYQEVRHGAPKKFISANVFLPERGLWNLSGYILSRNGAQALLGLLPCRGPVDLWMNHKFRNLKVRALRRSKIDQRRDLHSTNSYSILPALSRIGVLDGADASLFQRRPVHVPVFVFGEKSSGLSSLAMALSMLGYRCCSDFDAIPESELEALFTGRADRVFDAYVNIGSLAPQICSLKQYHPKAKFVVMENMAGSGGNEVAALRAALKDVETLHLHGKDRESWDALCEHLNLAPPDAEYPVVCEIGLRQLQLPLPTDVAVAATSKPLRHDPSPWVADSRRGWAGLETNWAEARQSLAPERMLFKDDLVQLEPTRWLLRNDTFPGNLGLFRPTSVTAEETGGVSLAVAKENLGVRNFSAAAISSRIDFLFGRFEATLQASDVPGVVTGFFLYRDSPRQEIDVEIIGSRPTELLVNVFYNPGADGAKFDYGYRGTPAVIPLGFDASKAFHTFEIEWNPGEIRWFVDKKLVHRRVTWNPTPIPHLPMTLHVNTWPARSREFAGRLAVHRLPAATKVARIVVEGGIART